MLYMWDFRRQPLAEAIDAYYDTLYSEEQPARDAFAAGLVEGVVEHVTDIDERIARHAEHWRMERMPSVDRNVLRLAVYEMMQGGTPRARGYRRSAGVGAQVFHRGIRAVCERRSGRRSAGTLSTDNGRLSQTEQTKKHLRNWGRASDSREVGLQPVQAPSGA